MGKRVAIAVGFAAWMGIFLFHTPPQWGAAAFVAFVGLSILFWSEYSTRQQCAVDELSAWLTLHADEILAGGADYKGIRVTGDTALVTYWVAICLVVYISLRPNGPRLESDRGLAWHRAISIAASLLFGWWAFPRGPMYMMRAIGRNLDPERVLVADVLATMKRDTKVAQT